jgi:predicted N-acetyltransferase YhbS
MLDQQSHRSATARKTKPYSQRLSAELVLRSVQDERDVERFVAFNTALNGAEQGITCDRLLRYHPEVGYDDFLLIEDERRGEIVSTTCLIPWRCRFGSVTLTVAMLEMVATHPDYRRQGLVRKQIERFHQVVNEQHFDLSIIEGIPYYYRQFGYAYATDHYGYDSLPAWRLPTHRPDERLAVALRPATAADAPYLTRLYAASMASLNNFTLRDEPFWRFLLERTSYPVWVVASERPSDLLGYLVKMEWATGGLTVMEHSISAAGVDILQLLAGETRGEIRLGWPATGTLVQLGRTWGSLPVSGDQWLLRIPDFVAFLNRIGPVLEERLAASDWRNLTANLVINLFRQALALNFVAGRLVKVAPLGFVDASMGADGGDLCIPPDAFVRLLFGYRSLEQLQDAWPDLSVKPGSQPILEQLFPQQKSCFLMPYLYRGTIPLSI